MSAKKQQATKTQTITIRIDDKIRFQLDFCSRITGMTITTFVERAIMEKALDVDINATYEADTGEIVNENLNWRAFWDPDESIRTIKLLKAPGMSRFTNFEEDQLIAFLKHFWSFYSEDPELTEVSRDHINALWPEIKSLVDFWTISQNQASEDINYRIRAILRDHKLDPLDDIPF